VHLNKIFIVLGLLFVCLVTTSSASSIWRAAEIDYSIYYDQKVGMDISTNCQHKECGAKILIVKAKELRMQTKMGEASKNPGSKYCEKLNAKVIIGRNDLGSENAFCQATDGTLVNLSSLGN
jgi:hypothetical protein